MNKLNIITSNPYAKYLNFNKEYNKLTSAYILNNTNGCGSGWTAKYIKDQVWSINFKIACTIHDLDYKFAKSRYWADRRLKQNIKAIANAYYKQVKKNLNIKWYQVWKWDDLADARIQRNVVLGAAEVYYIAVRKFGENAWDNAHLETRKKG